MKIYVAGPYAGRPIMVQIAERLIEAGHTVTSEWIRGTRDVTEATVGAAPGAGKEIVVEHAQGDLNDIEAADVVLMITGARVQAEIPGIPDDWLYTGGRHVETGYALARGKAVHMIGEPENVFARAFFYQHADVEDFLASTNKEALSG